MENFDLLTFSKGFALSATFIIAIGLQNAFILRQGLKNQHVFMMALIASLIDATLIALGVLGLGQLIEQHPTLLKVIRYGGAAFLIVYGLKSFYAAMKPSILDEKNAKGLTASGALKDAILVLLGVSFLNPHVYLDTVILLGGLSAAEGDPGRYIFGAGAMLASFVWFFSLAYGARLLSPLFEKPRTWQILDIFIGVVMIGIAVSLILH